MVQREDTSSASWQVAVRTLDRKLPSIFRLASDDTTHLDQQATTPTSFPAHHQSQAVKHAPSDPTHSHPTPSWAYHISHQDSLCSDHAPPPTHDSVGQILLKVLQSSENRQLCNLSLLKTSTQHWEQDKSLYYAPAGCNPATVDVQKTWTSSLRRSNVVPIKASTKCRSLHDPPPSWALAQAGVLFRIPTPQLTPPKCSAEGPGSTRASSTCGAASACSVSQPRASSRSGTSACSIRPAETPLSSTPTPMDQQQQQQQRDAAPWPPGKQATDGAAAGTAHSQTQPPSSYSSDASCRLQVQALPALSCSIPSPQGQAAGSTAWLDDVPAKQPAPRSPLRAPRGGACSPQVQAASPQGGAMKSSAFAVVPTRDGCETAQPAQSEPPGLRSPSASSCAQRQPEASKLDRVAASPAKQQPGPSPPSQKLRYSRNEDSQHATYSGPPLAARRSAPVHLSSRTSAALSALSRLSAPGPGPAVPRLHIPPPADAASPRALHPKPLLPRHSEQGPSYASVTNAGGPRLTDRSPSISYASLSSRRYAMLMDMLPPSARQQSPESLGRLPSARFLGQAHGHQGPQPPVSLLLSQLHSLQSDNADGAEPHGAADPGKPGQGRRGQDAAASAGGARHMPPVPLVALQSSLASTSKIKVMLNDVRDAGAHLQLCERSLVPAQHQQHLRAAGIC